MKKKKLLATAVVMAVLLGVPPSYARIDNTMDNTNNYPSSASLSNNQEGGNAFGIGGAVYNAAVMVIGDNIQIKNNFAETHGGAIYNDSTGNLTIGNNVLFSNNHTINHGGAISNDGGLLTIGTGAQFLNNGSVSILNLNSAQWTVDKLIGGFTGTGGGIDYSSANNFSLSQTVFTSNQALEGGGVFVYRDTTGDISISDTTFTSNAAGTAGGAVLADYNAAGTVNISDSTFNNNTAYASGGAVWTGKSTTIADSTFTGNKTTGNSTGIANRLTDIRNFVNRADVVAEGITLEPEFTDAARIEEGGGAIFVAENSAATITNSTFNNNSSATVGGAVATHAGATSLNITDSSFKNNSAAGNGGAIYSAVNLGISASTKDVEFSGNTAAAGKDIYFGTTGKTLSLTAAADKTISFDGGIDLNSGNLAITGAGNVLINAALNNASSLNLAAGSGLQLGQNFALTGTPNVTIAGALNSQNTKIDTFNVNNFTGGGTWDLDVDLASGTADYFNISGTNSGNLSVDVDKISFLSGSNGTSDISIDVSSKNILNVLNKNLYVDEFQLSQSLSDGKTLVFQYLTNPIAAVLTETDPTVYNLTKDLTIGALGAVAGADLTIKSDYGATITADTTGIAGFDVSTGKGLTLNNITLNGFDTGVTNTGGTLNLVNTSFLNIVGAAIDTDTDITIAANNGNSTFSGNSTAINLTNGANLTLDAQNNGVITLDDAVTSSGAYTLNVTGGSSGVVNLNNSLGNASVELTETTLALGDASYLNGLDFTANSGTLNMTTIPTIQALNLGTLTLNGNLNLAVKADLANSVMDTISASTYNLNGNNLNISRIMLLSDAADKITTLQFADDVIKGSVTSSVSKTAYSPIYQYDVNYDLGTGAFTFDRSSNTFNSAVMVAPVAAQLGGYFTQLNSYNEAFRNLDMKMLMTREERQALKMLNSYASADDTTPMIFSPLYLPEKEKAGWIRPYATFENVPLKGGARVSNVMYGSFFGGDSDYYELENGAEIQYSVYAGYNGSHQAYQGNSIYQNGGTLGATALLNKGNFFTALTANAGANMVDATTMYGKEDFPMLMAGVASKTGYNWELAKGKFIVQPNFLISYSFVNAFDYTNAAGVRIKSDPLNAIHLAPGLKFIGNLKNGWQPYAGVNVAWNIMDDTKFKANDVSLPDLSVKPYVEYGVGIQKRWGERFTGFAQTMFRSGGRNGLALSFGFRFALGK